MHAPKPGPGMDTGVSAWIPLPFHFPAITTPKDYSSQPPVQVDFVLQGEMGATIFMHPVEWMEVKDAVLERVTAPRPGQPDIEPAQVFFGMAVNNNKLCG